MSDTMKTYLLPVGLLVAGIVVGIKFGASIKAKLSTLPVVGSFFA